MSPVYKIFLEGLDNFFVPFTFSLGFRVNRVVPQNKNSILANQPPVHSGGTVVKLGSSLCGLTPKVF